MIVPGKADDSLVVRLTAGLEEDRVMPPKGERLTSQQVAALRAWIDEGAEWPGADGGEDGRDWWSLRPLIRPAVPVLAHGARNSIDAFVRAKLREKGLNSSLEADRRTLARRLYFDLIGLPPTPEELAAFVNDPAADAYEKLVDRLLASPHHGERWARHWLDVVHYGDTHGYDKDQPRPAAWPYRDYVIRSFNADRPYGEFVRQQVAGDVLEPGTADGIIAMGFIAAGPWDLIGHAELPESKLDGKIARHLDRDDMVSNTINTFVSLTIQCAQCHNHKFDPISQEDYYRLQAVFAALDRADRPYYRNPSAARKAAELIARQASLKKRQDALNAAVNQAAGRAPGELDRRIAKASMPAKARAELVTDTPSARALAEVATELGRAAAELATIQAGGSGLRGDRPQRRWCRISGNRSGRGQAAADLHSPPRRHPKSRPGGRPVGPQSSGRAAGHVRALGGPRRGRPAGSPGPLADRCRATR